MTPRILLPPNVSKYADIQGPLYLRVGSESNLRNRRRAADHLRWQQWRRQRPSTSPPKNSLTPDDHDHSTRPLRLARERPTRSRECPSADLRRMPAIATSAAQRLERRRLQRGTDATSSNPLGPFPRASPSKVDRAGTGTRQHHRLRERRHLFHLARAAGRRKGRDRERQTSTSTARAPCASSRPWAPRPYERTPASTAHALVGRWHGQVTPDGSHMAFVAQSNLTGYDSPGTAEMYLYDPESRPTRLCLLPCPTASRRSRTRAAARTASSSPTTAAPSSPPKTPWSAATRTRSSTSTSTPKARPQLITTGTGPTETSRLDRRLTNAPGLVGVSANGTDVYFATSTPWSPRTTTAQQLKIYDARTGGGFPAERDAPTARRPTSATAPAPPRRRRHPTAPAPSLGNAREAKAHKTKKHKKKRTQEEASRRQGEAGSEAGAKQGGKHHG